MTELYNWLANNDDGRKEYEKELLVRLVEGPEKYYGKSKNRSSKHMAPCFLV